MAVVEAIITQISEKPTMCDRCANAVPQRCPFMASKPEEIETVLDDMGINAVKYRSKNYNKYGFCGWYTYYSVTDCPAYREGPLPGIPEKNHD